MHLISLLWNPNLHLAHQLASLPSFCHVCKRLFYQFGQASHWIETIPVLQVQTRLNLSISSCLRTLDSGFNMDAIIHVQNV